MKKNNLILFGFILIKFLLQYLLYNPDYDLHRDEYLHLDQANHLAWGFQSVPPFTSWISYFIKLLGNGVFWVKFFPALFGALTLLIVWKTIEELKGSLSALILGSTCVLFSVLLRTNFLFQPNSFDVLCWTALYFALIKYINTENTKWLFVGSFVFGIGFLNKYNIAFLLIGLFPAILLTKHRKILLKKEFYLALAFGFLIIFPNLFWQYENGFPVIHHMKKLAETQLVNVNRIDFLKEQILYFFAALPVILASLYALLFYVPFKKFRLFFGSFVFTLVVFIYFKAKGYYAIGLYPIYFAFGAVFFGDKLAIGWKKYVMLVLILLPALFTFFIKDLIAIKSPEFYLKNENKFKNLGLLRWEDGKDHPLPQDLADMMGWKELAEKVDKILDQLPNKGQTLILCDNYGEAGAINYYSKNKSIKAVSFNADYINWFPLHRKIQNFIRVKEFEDANRELEKTGPIFEKYFKADSITNTFAREYGTTIFVFSGPKIDLNQRMKKEIEQMKNEE